MVTTSSPCGADIQKAEATEPLRTPGVRRELQFTFLSYSYWQLYIDNIVKNNNVN